MEKLKIILSHSSDQELYTKPDGWQNSSIRLIYACLSCKFNNYHETLSLHCIKFQRWAFVNFATLVYSSWWITCNSAVDAPWNDSQLYKSLLQYKVMNSDVTPSALHAFKLHLWYLTAEMIPLALWSSKVPDTERWAHADSLLAVKPETALLALQNRFGTGFGEPKFPASVTLATTPASAHSLLFNWTPNSWLKKLLTGQILLRTFLGNLQSQNVVNDCAERGVKLSSDVLASARVKEHYQNMLQVEKDRKELLNLRKRKEHSH